MDKLSRYTPPGESITALSVSLYGGALMLVILCIGFIAGGEDVWQAWGAESVLPLAALIKPWMKGVFAATALGPLMFIPFNYQYFYYGSKSIYVMHRLRNPWELHVRCWALPLLGFIIVCGFAVVTYYLFCIMYFVFSPEGTIPEQQITLFWRYIP